MTAARWSPGPIRVADVVVGGRTALTGHGSGRGTGAPMVPPAWAPADVPWG